MERCVFCQAPLPAGATTCPACGQQQPATDYIPPQGIPDQAYLPDDDAEWAEQTLPAQPESETTDEPPQPVVYQEFSIDPQATSLPPASGPAWAFAAPGASLSVPPPTAGPPAAPRPRRNYRKALAIILAVLIVLGAGGAAAYILTRPAPVIIVTSSQHSGSLPAGSPDLYFHVAGSDFTAKSAITFLLDGKSAPGAPKVTSDQSGAFTVDLPITDDWLLGPHTLTARDAQGYLTKNGARLAVLAAPVLSITSQYMQGALPAGSTGTALAYSGKRFALDSAITLELDGKPLASAAPITSDARGRFTGTIPVSAQLALGNHILTAQDAQGNVTRTAASFVIVDQGEAGTPGPNGAPPDDLSFSAYAHVTAKDASGQAISFTQTFDITGQPDPAGGTVCSAQDDGQPQTYTGTLEGSSITYTETVTFACRGSYKHGHLTYVEIDTSDTYVLSNGVRCSSSGPSIYGAFDGSFTDATTMSGVYFSDYFQANCTDGSYIYLDSSVGTWTGGL